MVDTHCHLDTQAFDDDRQETLQRALDSGVEAIVIPAIEPQHFNRVIDLAESNSNVYCGIGIHPHNVTEATPEALSRVEQLSHNNRVVAIGEIGLDYYYDFAPRDVQKKVLRQQIALAKDRELPVILHNRDSDDDMMAILEEEQDGRLRGVLHCFSSTPDMARRALDAGMMISFTGNITYKKSILGPTVQAVPLDRIMIETDAPYMTPVPHRGKRNEPAFVRFIAEKIAELHSVSIDEVFSMTTQTAKRFFHLALLMLCVPCVLLAQADDNASTSNNRFPKLIGIGGVVGTNTIVETQEGGGDISYDGLFTYGGALSYYFITEMSIEASILYSKNTKVLETQALPNTHTVVDVAALYHFNANNKLSFFAALGPSYFINSYNGETESLFGLNFGVGLQANIPTPIGMFTPAMEWRVSTLLKSRERRFIDITQNIDKIVPVTFFSSIPRFKLLWFPSL